MELTKKLSLQKIDKIAKDFEFLAIADKEQTLSPEFSNMTEKPFSANIDNTRGCSTVLNKTNKSFF